MRNNFGSSNKTHVDKMPPQKNKTVGLFIKLLCNFFYRLSCLIESTFGEVIMQIMLSHMS